MYTEQKTGGDKNGKDDPYGYHVAVLDCAIAAVKEIGE